MGSGILPLLLGKRDIPFLSQLLILFNLNYRFLVYILFSSFIFMSGWGKELIFI